jgi:predicted amidohydrolase
MAIIRCGTVQFHHHADDKAYNLSVIESFVQKAAGQGVQVLAFPEMCITGYWHVRNLSREALDALSEPVPKGKSVQAVLAGGVAIGVGIGLRRSPAV